MTQAQLLSLARLRIPEINSTDVISDADLLIILNLACVKFINRTDALPTSSLFNLVLNLNEYSLASYVSTFGKIRKEGLWIYNAENSKWNPLSPTTMSVLNRDFPSWINADSSIPRYYSLDGDTLTLYPKASATYAGTNYLKIYHFARSTDMAGSTQYPFSGSASIRYPHLADFEEVLIDYVRYEMKEIIGKAGDGAASQSKFYLECDEIKKKLMSRPDLIPYIQSVGAGNLQFHQGAFQR